jgi:hypothetical protein
LCIDEINMKPFVKNAQRRKMHEDTSPPQQRKT